MTRSDALGEVVSLTVRPLPQRTPKSALLLMAAVAGAALPIVSSISLRLARLGATS